MKGTLWGGSPNTPRHKEVSEGPTHTHTAWGVKGEWEQSSAALWSQLHYWGCEAARKSRGNELVVPREWQLPLGAGHENTRRNHRL